MSKKAMNRRQFLQTSSLAAAGAVALGSGGLAAWSRALAADMTLDALDRHTAATLLAVARRTYPHRALGDLYYVGVVEALDAEAAKNPDLATQLAEGVATLDGAFAMPFLDLSEGNQLQVLTALADSPFFQKVRGTTVVALYNDPLAWRHFGYEGPSYEFGGYLHRGFDDLAWLPQPPEDASPKAG